MLFLFISPVHRIEGIPLLVLSGLGLYSIDLRVHSSDGLNIKPSAKPPSQRDLDSIRRTMCTELSKDLETIFDWGARNLVQFNASETQSCLLSNKNLKMNIAWL